MKLLTLVRHAKSDWDNDLQDIDRPLNKRGKNDAPLMGKIVSTKLPSIDKLYSSPAVRAYSTAHAFANELNIAPESICQDQSLYHCGISEYLELIHQNEPETQHIIIFSHNPGTTNFVNFLCNQNIFNIPTCGVSHIELNIENWNEVTRDSGMIKHYLIPKSYK